MQFARVLYLHGFASGPGSKKAVFLAERLRAQGWRVTIPVLDSDDFEHLTISRQLKVIEDETGDEPVVLIGSSLGGYLAALYAARHSEVRCLVLLAPAFRFYERWRERLTPEEWKRWQDSAGLSVFHYGEGHDRRISFDLMRDAMHYEAYPDFHQPAMIFHGTQDPLVPVQYSAAFVRAHTNAKLIELNSGHELTDVLEPIFYHLRTFLPRYGSV
jgi:uncharacterized protein